MILIHQRVVVVVGSPDWTERGPIAAVVRGADVVVTGDTSCGACRIAGLCALEQGAELEALMGWPPDPSVGHAALLRVAQLHAAVGHAVSCHAFPMPASSRTWDAVAWLMTSGLEVEVHELSEAAE